MNSGVFIGTSPSTGKASNAVIPYSVNCVTDPILAIKYFQNSKIAVLGLPSEFLN